jgi:hypothetical protein
MQTNPWHGALYPAGAPGASSTHQPAPAGGGAAGLGRALIGRPFLNPLLELLFIGGGLSLAATVVMVLEPRGHALVGAGFLPWILLLSNSAHFAASSVRLYTKPGAVRSLPVTALGLPVAALGMFALGLLFPGRVGPTLQAMYLTWSPFHYAAQAYGIAMIYAGRAGRRLGDEDRRLLRAIALVPFIYMTARMLAGWLPAAATALLPSAGNPERGLGLPLIILGLAAPLAFHAGIWRRDGQPLPLMCLLPLVSNSIWFFVLDPLDAFLWATIFHGLQYMTLVLIFHVRDGGASGGGERRHAGESGQSVALSRLAGFYLGSVGLGYALFILLPAAGAAFGAGYQDSRLIAVALVNIHHFLVDAQIWRLGRNDGNRRIVEEDPGLPSTGPG